jgi:Ankyrin repeats (3 copies)
LHPNGDSRYCGFRLLAARAGSFDLSPPIDDFPKQYRIYDAIRANDFDWALRIVTADPDEVECPEGIPPPLQYCIDDGDPKWLEWLLDHGADIERRDQDYGSTPLTMAVIHRQKRHIPILVARGANTEGQLKRARDGLAGAYEEFFDRQGYQEIVELLQGLGVEE